MDEFRVRTLLSRKHVSHTPPFEQGDSSFVLNVTDRRTGGSVVGYRDKIKNNQSATSSFTGIKTKVKSIGEGSCYALAYQAPPYNKTPVYWFGEGNMGYTPDTSSPSMSITVADNSAKTNVLQKIRAAQTQMSGGVFLGEIRETLHMLRRPAFALRQGVVRYLGVLQNVKRTVGSAKRRQRILGETWLEFAFGWRPLVADTLDAVEAIKSVLGVPSRARVSGRGFDQQLVSTSNSTLSGWPGYPLWWKYNQRTTETVQVRYIASLKGTKSPAPDKLSDHAIRSFGLGLNEFVPTVWELLPWSFLVDYFVNVGDILGAVFTDTSNVAWYCKTVRQTRNFDVGYSFDTAKAAQTMANFVAAGGSMSNTEVEVTMISRSNTGPSTPDLMIKCPGLSTKWINMAALWDIYRHTVPFR
jgi:hypothetical protein